MVGGVKERQKRRREGGIIPALVCDEDSQAAASAVVTCAPHTCCPFDRHTFHAKSPERRHSEPDAALMLLQRLSLGVHVAVLCTNIKLIAHAESAAIRTVRWDRGISTLFFLG